ncbi:uncharacterized protein EV420DRAFT_1768101 [Desarmillaria tabescens]|uniref:DUF6534 domain-containing protein n=1 Tax=Armillaria tabescens TaxID=1929756 RepID=A0AA39MSV1_ARMTA|nr:uncharacterized protein EV420DRAFT_1768101 [Desarmillaria tabescens]KAK0444993.1 hypothetical protein EV420DRAFT_1768101 [Desarmillaria tabescens]
MLSNRSFGAFIDAVISVPGRILPRNTGIFRTLSVDTLELLKCRTTGSFQLYTPPMPTLPSALAENISIAPSDVYRIAGPLLIGCFLNCTLYGVLCNQVYIYYISFPKDRLVSKIVVYVLWLTETVQTIINIADTFKVFCYDFGNLSELDDVHLSWFSVPILSGFVGCVSQLFYAWRMYKFSKKARWMSVTLSMIAFIQFAAAIACGIEGRRYDHYSDLRMDPKDRMDTMIWLGGSALCDTAIALCMTYLLSRAHTGFKSTRILLSRLIRLTIETGTVTATLAVIDIALFQAYPNHTYHTVPAICLVKVYSNTVLAVCNSRMTRRIRGGREDATIDVCKSFDLSSGGLNIAEFQGMQTDTNAESLQFECPQGDERKKKAIGLLPADGNSPTVNVLSAKPT